MNSNAQSQTPSSSKIRPAGNAEGFLFFFTCVALGAAAIGSGKNGLVLLFCSIFAAVIIFLTLAILNIRHPLKIERRFVEEVFAGRETRIDLIVTNLGKMPVFGLHIYEVFEDGRTIGPIYIPRLSPGETASARYMCIFPSRGRSHFCKFQIRSSFPLPFIELRSELDAPDDILVYPEPLDGTDQITFVTVEAEYHPNRSKKVNTSIRELVHGRRVGRILWKLSARRQIWLEEVPIRKKDTGGSPAIIIHSKQSLGPERFERQLSQVTHFVLEQILGEKKGEIQVDALHLPYGKTPVQRKKLLETLASL